MDDDKGSQSRAQFQQVVSSECVYWVSLCWFENGTHQLTNLIFKMAPFPTIVLIWLLLGVNMLVAVMELTSIQILQMDDTRKNTRIVYTVEQLL